MCNKTSALTNKERKNNVNKSVIRKMLWQYCNLEKHI